MVFFKEESGSLDIDVGMIVSIGCFAVGGEVREVDGEGGVEVVLERFSGLVRLILWSKGQLRVHVSVLSFQLRSLKRSVRGLKGELACGLG